MEKEKNPPSGNKHDFFSLALFWWPDNTKKDLVPYVYRDGVFNPEVYSIPDRKNIHDMIYRVKILSVAYYLTNNTLYASKATELLRVWFLNNDTQMNPNLQFAEVIYGKNNGSASGIITTSYFSEVLDSIKLLQSSSAWTIEDQRGIETWFKKYLVWLMDSDFGKREHKRLNNHGTWYDFQTSSIALFLNKTEIVREIIRSNIEQKIDTKIDSNGSQPYEKERSKSMDYHIYNLQAFFNLARVGDYVGIDLWHYESSKGSSLKKAIDYLLPYALNNKAWPYKQEGLIGEDNLADIMCQASKHYESTSYRQIYKAIIPENRTDGLDSLLYGCISN